MSIMSLKVPINMHSGSMDAINVPPGDEYKKTFGVNKHICLMCV